MVKKNVLCSTAEKKNKLLLIRCEKNCMFKPGIKKSLSVRKTLAPPPPHVSNGPPLTGLHDSVTGSFILQYIDVYCQFT